MAEAQKVSTEDPYAGLGTPAGDIQQPEQKDEYAGLGHPVESTPMQKLGAIGKGAQSGLLESLPQAGGTVAGAAIGTLGGPFAPITVPLGAAAGFGAGYLFGKGAKKLLDVPEPDQLPPDQRPFAYAGEFVGGGIPYAGAPIAAARLGIKPAANWLRKIVDYAAEKPGSFFKSETAGLVAGGGAGATAEAYDPGDPLARFGAEVVGGLLSPTRLLSNAMDTAVGSAKTAIQSLTAAGRETKAAQYLQDIVSQSGEDPQVLAELLRRSDIPGVNLTSAQKTGSPALAVFEAQLAKDSAKFGANAEKAATDAFDTSKNLVIALRGTGDPNALAAAAQIREQYFRTLLATRLNYAENEVVTAARRITSDTPRDRVRLSQQAGDIVERALGDARNVERDLWSRIPRDEPATADNLIQRYDQIKGDLLPEESLPNVVEGFVRRLKGEPAPSDELRTLMDRVFGSGTSQAPQAGSNVQTTSGELLRFRSRALALARESDAAGKSNEARIYGQLAESALDDLGSIASPFAQDARTFSRELNDTFTRTFAGDTMATRASGADRIPPEILFRRALGGGAENADLRLRQLDEATSFLTRRGLGSPEAAQNVNTMLDAQDRIIRLAASDVIDPNTGRVSAVRLNKFIRDNEVILDRFPEVRTDLQNAARTEQGLRDLQALNEGASRIIQKEAAFAKIGKFDSPAQAVTSALSSKTPESDFTAIAKLAQRGGPDAVAGLRAAAWDHALSQATDQAGNVSLGKLRSAFLDPPQPGITSLKDQLVSNGILDQAGAKRLDMIFDETARIEKVLEAGGDLKEILALPGAMTELVMRVAGSKLGSTVAHVMPGMGGGSLIAQSAGSKFVRDMFGRVPIHRVQQVFVEAAENPRFMAMLLEKPVTQQQGIKLARNIHSYLVQAGLTTSEDASENQGPQSPTP